MTLSKFIERLSFYKLCSGITLPDTRKEINFINYFLPEVFNYFDYKTADLNQLVFQDKYFRTSNCNLLLLSPKNTCKICGKENIQFNSDVNSKMVSLAKPAHLNALNKVYITRKNEVDFTAEKVAM